MALVIHHMNNDYGTPCLLNTMLNWEICFQSKLTLTNNKNKVLMTIKVGTLTPLLLFYCS